VWVGDNAKGAAAVNRSAQLQGLGRCCAVFQIRSVVAMAGEKEDTCLYRIQQITGPWRHTVQGKKKERQHKHRGKEGGGDEKNITGPV